MPDPSLSKDLVDLALLYAVLPLKPISASRREPGSAMEKLGQVRSRRAGRIREAFEPAFAERMHRSLDASTTRRVYEAYNIFHIIHHNFYRESEYPPDLPRRDKVFSSAATKTWATWLAGRPCEGQTAFSASHPEGRGRSIMQLRFVPVLLTHKVAKGH